MADTRALENIEDRVIALEKKAATAEKWIWVISIVAVIFGVGAAGLWQMLQSASNKASEAKKEAAEASDNLKTEGKRVLTGFRPDFDQWVADARVKLEKLPSDVPRGTIVAWYSTSGPVPAGWVLCDGNNGAPDLRDRFLMGVGQFAAVGSPGGENHLNVSIPIGALYLSTGGTDHSYALRGDPACNGCGITNHRTSVNYLVNSFTKDSKTSADFDNRPAYVSVAYIMKL